MRRYLGGVVAVLLTLGTFTPGASTQGTTGPNVIILLQLAGESEALAQIGSCLATRLSRMPDVEIATAPTLLRFNGRLAPRLLVGISARI